MVQLQWKDRLALEQEWMELYVDMPQEIEVLWMNHAESIKWLAPACDTKKCSHSRRLIKES